MEDNTSDSTDYEPPQTRLGEIREMLFAGYIAVRLRIHRFVREHSLVDDELDDKYCRHCEECDELKAMSHATLRPAADDFHDVESIFLECGHTDENPEMRLADPVVKLFQMDSPDVIDVVDVDDEVSA